MSFLELGAFLVSQVGNMKINVAKSSSNEITININRFSAHIIIMIIQILQS